MSAHRSAPAHPIFCPLRTHALVWSCRTVAQIGQRDYGWHGYVTVTLTTLDEQSSAVVNTALHTYTDIQTVVKVREGSGGSAPPAPI